MAAVAELHAAAPELECMGHRSQGPDTHVFRRYGDEVDEVEARTSGHYKAMFSNQCVESVERMYKKWHGFDKGFFSIREAFRKLEGYVDTSDPDTELPNMIHMMQCSESMRRDGMPDWMVLTGLLHDMGKMMFVWGDNNDGQGLVCQWGLGGDTWVVGCPIPSNAVYPKFHHLNKDAGNPQYQGALGMYEKGCGLDKLMFAYGHDEYMYQCLKFNKAKIPEAGMAMIRYHSCYPLLGGAYKDLLAEGDYEILEQVRKFNSYDLYTKADVTPDVEALWPYYQSLIDKYLPEKLHW